MNNENLIAYLNDHLAGSVAALAMLDHMSMNAQEDDFRIFCTSLHNEIESDQTDLRNVIDQVGGEGGAMKRAAAWLMEKAGWTEMKIAGVNKNELGRLQALEGLALGITGKKNLWVALATIPHLVPPLENVAFGRLIARAEEQIERVEVERLRVVETAFS